MKEFFHSKTFKILLIVLVLLVAFFLRAVYIGGLMPLASDLGGAIAAPIGQFFSNIGNSIHDWFKPIFEARELQKQNEALKQQVAALTDKLVDYDEMKNQNELYREFLAISDNNTSYSLEPATVIARAADDRYDSFIINAGTSSGVSAGMPVITDTGLVGVVTQVSYSYCKVSSLLDPNVSVGVLDSATQDTGVLSGDPILSESGITRMGYISRSSKMAAGDVLITSGYGGLIPQGLIVGYVESVAPDSTGLSLAASVRPAAPPDEVRRVFVILDYAEKAPAADAVG